jgi:hypothetical protein
MIRSTWALILLLPLCGWAWGPASAHSSSNAYLDLTVQSQDVDVQWSIALRDIDDAVGLDTASNGAITWGEARQRFAAIDDYVLPKLVLASGGRVCEGGPVEHLADRLSDGGYLVLRFARHCAEPIRSLTIDYNLLFELDPQHRGLLNVSFGNGVQATAFSPAHRQQTFDAQFAPFETFKQFFLVGVDHLLTGIDHLLFITMLLVPAMFRRDASESGRKSGWIPVPRFGAAFVETIKVLSAFTLAHAMTLTSAVLGYVHIPAQLIEALIALTILATAIDNIRPILPGRRWMLAFAFGLIHGFGFANALGPLALPGSVLALALLSFNLGLEAAQIAVAALTLPFGFAFRNTSSYQAGLLPGVSALVAIIASAWFIDRAGDLGLMPF